MASVCHAHQVVVQARHVGLQQALELTPTQTDGNETHGGELMIISCQCMCDLVKVLVQQRQPGAAVLAVLTRAPISL